MISTYALKPEISFVLRSCLFCLFCRLDLMIVIFFHFTPITVVCVLFFVILFFTDIPKFN